MNFWTGFTTERNLKESSEEGNDHLSTRLRANLGHHLSKTTHTVLEALIGAFKAIVIALIEVLKLATGEAEIYVTIQFAKRKLEAHLFTILSRTRVASVSLLQRYSCNRSATSPGRRSLLN